jgi:hypothetical protein
MTSNIATVAYRVRKWAEKQSYKSAEIDSPDLCGLCAIASAKLFDELRKVGIDSYIAVSIDESHCFVVVPQNDDFELIVDVTATQFGSKFGPVEILAVSDAFNKDFWQIGQAFRDVKALNKYQFNAGWPKFQIARIPKKKEYYYEEDL